MVYALAGVAIATWIIVVNWHFLLTWTQIRTDSDTEIGDQTRSRSMSDVGLTGLVQHYPKSISPGIAWVNIKIIEGLWGEALERANIMRGRFPRRPEPYVVCIKALAGTGNLHQAEITAVEAFSKFPSNPDILAEYASVAHRRKEWKISQERWHALTIRSPDKGIGYVWEARAFLEMGEWAAADRVLKDAFKMVSRHRHEFLVDYADLPHRQEDWKEASERWISVRSLMDTKSIGYWRGCEAFRRLGRTDLAAEVLRDALVLFPKDTDVLREQAALEVYPKSKQGMASIKDDTSHPTT